MAAQFENLVMLFIGTLHTVRQEQLQASVTLAAVVNVANDSPEPRLIGARVKDGMKLPVQPSPTGDMVVSPKFADILTQHCCDLGEIIFGKARNGEL